MYSYPWLANWIRFKRIGNNKYKVYNYLFDKKYILTKESVDRLRMLDGNTDPLDIYSELSEGKSINQSFKNAKIKLKSDSRLFSNQNKEFEIKKLKIFSISNDFLAPYAFNEEGKLSINENVKIHFDSKIY